MSAPATSALQRAWPCPPAKPSAPDESLASESPVARVWARLLALVTSGPALVASSVPRSLHVWLLRVVLLLPGLDPTVEAILRRYVAGQPIADLPPHSAPAPDHNSASLASEASSFRPLCFRARTPPCPFTIVSTLDISTSSQGSYLPELTGGIDEYANNDLGSHMSIGLNGVRGPLDTIEWTVEEHLPPVPRYEYSSWEDGEYSVPTGFVSPAQTRDGDPYDIQTPFKVWRDSEGDAEDSGHNDDSDSERRVALAHDERGQQQRSISPPEASSSEESSLSASPDAGFDSIALETATHPSSSSSAVSQHHNSFVMPRTNVSCSSSSPQSSSRSNCENDGEHLSGTRLGHTWSSNARTEFEEGCSTGLPVHFSPPVSPPPPAAQSFNEIDALALHISPSYTGPHTPVVLAHGQDRYYIYHKLGAGGYGSVFLASHRASGQRVAIKAVRKRVLYRHTRGRQAMKDELANWRKITEAGEKGGRGLVRLLESFDDDMNVYFVMRLYYETLEHRMRIGEPFHLREILLYSAEMISALHALHNLGIMHRDIKPSNVLIAPDGHLALTDYGLSYSPPPSRLPASRVRRRHPYNDFVKRMSGQQVGTSGYWAPEVRLFAPEKGHAGGARAASDVYSMGVVILEMALNERDPFFKGKTPEEVDEDMKTREMPWARLGMMDWGLCDMLKRMLATIPQDRWTTDALMGHPYFAELHFPLVEQGEYMPTYYPRDPEPTHCGSVNLPYFHFSQQDDPVEDGSPAITDWIDAQLREDEQTRAFEYSCPKKWRGLALTGCADISENQVDGGQSLTTML